MKSYVPLIVLLHFVKHEQFFVYAFEQTISKKCEKIDPMRRAYVRACVTEFKHLIFKSQFPWENVDLFLHSTEGDELQF